MAWVALHLLCLLYSKLGYRHVMEKLEFVDIMAFFSCNVYPMKCIKGIIAFYCSRAFA